MRSKALLSLKDLNLEPRLEELLEAGVSSLKIEGRLKNESYVKNVVRSYDLRLRSLGVPRASFGFTAPVLSLPGLSALLDTVTSFGVAFNLAL